MDPIQIIVTSILGSGGVVGFFFYLLRIWLDKKLDTQDIKRKKQTEYHIKRNELENKRSSCYGKLFFWMHKSITDTKYDNELNKAFSDLQKVEDDIKELEQHRLAELNSDSY